MPAAFTPVTSVIAYLPIANLDTDMLIPKHYLKTVTRSGLGKYLFAELRYDESNHPKPDFILNRPDYQQAAILMAEENFGCGSSREHAVWSLLDFGIKVVIAPSFADIFYNNCFKNGLLPIRLSHDIIQQLMSHLHEKVTVDLHAQHITAPALHITFAIEPYRQETLLKGLDEIDETLLFAAKINAFEIKQRQEQPWLYSGVKKP